MADDAQRSSVRTCLEKILSSPLFAGSERHRQLLRFLVEQTLEGNSDNLNEFVLGLEVFNKNETFDPRVDSIVRVEARRLRARLDKYYQGEGKNDPIVIGFRARSFVPEFKERDVAASARSWRPPKAWALAIAGVAAAIVIATVVLGLLIKRYPMEDGRPEPASILLLPFQNLSEGAGEEHLGESIDDALISGLTRVPGLRVISRGSALKVGEEAKDPVQNASSLDVDYIVEGSVEAGDGQLHVSAKMTHVPSESYVWAESYERPINDLVDIEQELSEAIASQVRVALGPGLHRYFERRRSSNPRAYAAYLRGQYFWYRWGEGSTERSLELFQEAIRLDPDFAPAWAWLSQTYQIMAMHGGSDAVELTAKGRQAAEKSLALDGDLAEGHAALASCEALEGHWLRSDEEFRRAIDLNPGWAHGRLMYSELCLTPTGRLDEALHQAMSAIELDPLNQTYRESLADILYLRRDYARAVEEYEQLPEANGNGQLNPSYVLALDRLGRGADVIPRLRAEMERDPQSPFAASLLGYLLAQNGRIAEARELQRKLEAETRSEAAPDLLLALIDIGLGDNDAVFRRLESATRLDILLLGRLKSDPVFDPLRADPRFDALLSRAGLDVTFPDTPPPR